MSKIADSRKRNQQLREEIQGKNSVQLKNFFKGFDEEALGAIQKAVNGAVGAKKEKVIKATEKQIAKLQKKLLGLKK